MLCMREGWITDRQVDSLIADNQTPVLAIQLLQCVCVRSSASLVSVALIETSSWWPSSLSDGTEWKNRHHLSPGNIVMQNFIEKG